jgi:hypothetical protein
MRAALHRLVRLAGGSSARRSRRSGLPRVRKGGRDKIAGFSGAGRVTELARIYSRRAALLRELAELEEALGRAVSETLRASPAAVPAAPDETFSLAQAAAHLGEPPETFRRRLDYRKARVSRPGERRLRYSRAELDRIQRDRLAVSSCT